MKLYQYVGPPHLKESATSECMGHCIRSTDDLLDWLASQFSEVERDGEVTATFVVNSDGFLLLAPRRSEHVACAGGSPVFSAGEIAFAAAGKVTEASNQSTGYCPEPESWLALATALDRIGVERPSDFTSSITFRLCTACSERNIVKDNWFFCDLCEAELPEVWNFPQL